MCSFDSYSKLCRRQADEYKQMPRIISLEILKDNQLGQNALSFMTTDLREL